MKRARAWFSGLKLNIKFTILIVGFVLLPIIILSAWIFHSMVSHVIIEKKSAMSYKIDKSYDEIVKNVDSISMAVQFILGDEELNQYIVGLRKGQTFTTEELMQLYKGDIAYLERMVNNNPYLYQSRVYVDSNTMQEMMPILYRSDRMKRLAWAEKEVTQGWKFNYTDTIFSSFVNDQQHKIMSYVTMFEEFDMGEIAVLEVAMQMKTMFPSLYEANAKEWSCFIDSENHLYFGDHKSPEQVKKASYITQEILEQNSITDMKSYVDYRVIDQMDFVVGYQQVKELNGILISVAQIDSELYAISTQRNWFIFAVCIIVVLLGFAINAIVKSLLKKFYQILQSIREVQKGDLNVVIPDCGTNEMGELGNQINKMLVNIKQLTDDNLKHELLIKNTQIRALQNQINSHFIYNVLESIKMMAEIDEKFEISDSITTLGKLLRYSMKWTSNNVTIREEIEYIRNYLALINLRFDYEIYLSLNLSEYLYEQEIPKMSLQPIVENAIYHGIEQMAEDTSIYIKGIEDGSDYIIEITDSGKGMSEEEVRALYQKILGEVEASGGSGNGIGLKNVQDRIKMCFGKEYGIEILSKLGCYTKIRIRLPLTKHKER